MDKLFPVFDKSSDLKSRTNLSGTIGQNLFLLLTEDLQIKARALSRWLCRIFHWHWLYMTESVTCSDRNSVHIYNLACSWCSNVRFLFKCRNILHIILYNIILHISFFNSSLPFYPLHRRLDISRAIAAESLPVHIGCNWTRTGNLWRLSLQKTVTPLIL